MKHRGSRALFACVPIAGVAIAVGCGGDVGADLFEEPQAVSSGSSGKRGSAGDSAGVSGSNPSSGRSGGGRSQGGSSQGGRDNEGGDGEGASAPEQAGAGSDAGGGSSVGNAGHGNGAEGGEQDSSGGTAGVLAGSGGDVGATGGVSQGGAGNGGAGSGGAGSGGAGNASGAGGTSGTSGASGSDPGGGSGGGPVECDDCDDANPCTDDVCTKDGCEHTPNDADCDDGDACTHGDVCQDGSCKSGAAETCDDGNVCTIDTCDPDGGCGFTAATGGAEIEVDQAIPDNNTSCGTAPSSFASAKVTLNDPGTVGTVVVSVDFRHDWAGDVLVELIHAGKTIKLVNQPPNGMGTNAGKFDGVYTFRAGASVLPVRQEGQTIPPGAYRPNEGLAPFNGEPIAGDWTLRLADYCSGDDGDFFGFSLDVRAECLGAGSCEGLCSAGSCDCN